MKLKLRFIYTLHMLIPVQLACWHIQRLGGDTLRGLREMFP